QDQVDAWVVWDPYTSSTEVNANAKLLVNGEGLTSDRDFFVSTEDFATNQEELLNAVLNEVSETMDWANSHHEELIELLATELKMDEASVTLAVERRVYGVEDINDDILKEQQEMADLFYTLEIIPNEIKVNEAAKQ
ncbi:MAG: aliphatic sulfonate ABC transporter substrate-binding protein, partial [Bacillus sp. (in: firmicutes)]